jgi:hypothetical protein
MVEEGVGEMVVICSLIVLKIYITFFFNFSG